MKLLAGMAVIVLLVAAVTAMVAGIGVLLSWLLPLTVFEAALLFLGTTLVLILIISQIAQGYRTSLMQEFFGIDIDDDEVDRAPLRPRVFESPPVGRNEPCPCGSGKKFKHCCARKPSRA